MIPLLCLGDSIATYEGIGQYLECQIHADVGRSSTYYLHNSIPAAEIYVISLGSNDPIEGLAAKLVAIRAQIVGKVIWIVPAERQRALAVAEASAVFQDQLVYFAVGLDEVHPRSYPSLSATIQGALDAL
jgi:hypothetical protein